MRYRILVVTMAALAACSAEPPAATPLQQLSAAPASQWDLGILRLELALQKAADAAAFGAPQPSLFVHQDPDTRRLVLSANIFGRQHGSLESAREECALVVTRVRQLLAVSGDRGEPFEASGSALSSYFQTEGGAESLAGELDGNTDVTVSVFAGDAATLLTCHAPLVRGEIRFEPGITPG